MEWAPAAILALLFAFAVATLISQLVPVRKTVSSSSSCNNRPIAEQRKADTFGSAIAESITSTSDFTEHSSHPRHSFYTQCCIAEAAIEPSIDKDGLPQDFCVSSRDTEPHDGLQDETEVAVMASAMDIAAHDGKEDVNVDSEAHVGKEDVNVDSKTSEDDMSHKSVEDDDIDDWEGVESSELEETFGTAANHVANLAIEQRLKVFGDAQLQLYALYKLATEGPCTTPQPSALKIAARAKWNAWQKLGIMEPEEAMLEYVRKVTDMDSTWNAKSQKNREPRGKSLEISGDTSKERGRVGPVLSTLATINAHEGARSELDAIHACARDGDESGILQILEMKTPIDLKDDEGLTALHWAADRGQLNIVKILISRGAEIQAKDQEGQTPLHYATACEQEAVAKYLVQHGADPLVCDYEGATPLSCCPSSWVWMISET